MTASSPTTSLCLLAVALALGASACSKPDRPQMASPEDLRQCDTAPDDETGVAACQRAVDAGVLETGQSIPETERFYERLGTALERYGKYDGAVRVWRAAVYRFPARADFHYRLGRLLLETFSAYEEAYGPLSEAVRRGSTDPKVRTLLKEALEQMGRAEEARSVSR